jgi:hypothetical protein
LGRNNEEEVTTMKNRFTWMGLAGAIVLMASISAIRAEEGNEVKVKFADCPAAVQKTITEQAGGAKVETVDKETGKDGKVTYEVDAVIGGKNYEIKVAADGTLIGKTEDKEEEEKGKKKTEATK